MICPACGYDNINGVDQCDGCGQSLASDQHGMGELEQAITGQPVSAIATTAPESISASMPVKEAINLLTERRIGCVLVNMDGGQFGIFTERDVLMKISADLATLQRPVGEFTTADPVVLERHDSIAYALHAMDVGGYRHLPIVDQERKPIGIVSVRDILSFVRTRFANLRMV